MSTQGSNLLDLADRKSWGEMTEYERDEFNRWLAENPSGAGHNLFLLVRQALRFRRRSNSETLRAVKSDDDDGS